MEFEVTIRRVEIEGLAGGGPAGADPPVISATEGDEITARQDALKDLVGSLTKRKIEDLIGEAEAVTVTFAKARDAGVRVR